MDSLTQIVLGAAVGEAVLGKKVGYRAMLWGAIAGTIPDLDVYMRLFTDPITSTELHRGISHSLFFSLVMAPILGYSITKRPKWLLVGLLAVIMGYPIISTGNLWTTIILGPSLLISAFFILRRKEDTIRIASRREWSWLVFWSLVTHPLLDAHTTWGTQFFWPFDYRLAYKNIFVADPLYTVPFLICVTIALCYKRTNRNRRRWNNAGLIISTTYMALSFVFKGIGMVYFKDSLENQNISYVEMDTKPTPLNILLWNAHVETETGYRSGYYSIFDTKKDIIFSDEFPKNHELLEPYLDQKVVQQLLHITVGWYTVEETKDENVLILTDLRFGQFGLDPNDSEFVAKYELTITDGIVSAVPKRPALDAEEIGTVMNSLIERIKGE